MTLRQILILFTVFITTHAAEAQIKVVSAYYGRPKPERTVDVKKTVQAMASVWRTSFQVSPATFKVNPNPGRRNTLVVQYYAYGQTYTERADDGQVFTFRGAVGTRSSARVRFENGYGQQVYLYELDRWGAWHWKAKLDRGTSYTSAARAGDQWVVTDRRGRVLRQVVVPRGGGTIRLR